MKWTLRVFALIACVSSLAAQDADGGDIEIVYLANEGLLLRSVTAPAKPSVEAPTPAVDEQVVLIDAFVKDAYSMYAGLPEEVHDALVAAEAPFDSVDLCLVSHAHPDHYQPETGAAFLGASAATELVSTPEVVSVMRRHVSDGVSPERLRELLPETGKRTTFRHAGIDVTMLRLPHAGRFRGRIQNLGHVITLGGMKVLHLGDADAHVSTFEAYDLPSLKLDVALVPYWHFYTDVGRTVVREHIAARHVIAVHVPPSEVEQVQERLAESMPGVMVFERSMEARRFSSEQEKAPAADPAETDEGDVEGR